MTDYEKTVVFELNKFTNSMVVFAKGMSIPKLVACFLYQYRISNNCSPYLIFLINFTDSEFVAIEHFLKGEDDELPLTLVNVATTDHLSTKRIESYLKGGVFAVSYKALVLDLLTKKLDPSILTGFIINNVHN